MEKCPFCLTENTMSYIGKDSSTSLCTNTVDCPICGQYKISMEFAEDIDKMKEITPKVKAILSGYTREKTYLKADNYEIPVLLHGNYQDIYNSPIVPRSVSEKVYKLLNYLNVKASDFGEPVSINLSLDRSITYSVSQKELREIIYELYGEHLIDIYNEAGVKHGRNLNPDIIILDKTLIMDLKLTMKGIQYLEQ
ncbi:MAG: hypothetical protein LBQ83_01090 [Candidatus Margulisbacteria bacterium]|jgi:hypothetical protein|nr:hypothetical protein [Candidatus Margulisiibacteriota bacterium]